MTDRDALYRAILDSPEDDTLRLVYADALEESGDPHRAAFVRAQVELSHLPEYDPLWVRARCLGHGRTYNPLWTAELELPDGVEWALEAPFRRGLPGAVRAPGGAFVEHADELFAQYPIEALEVTAIRPQDTQTLPACAWLERLASLALVQGAGGPTVTQVLASPHLTRLCELRLGPEMTTPAALRAIARSRVFRNLTALAVRSDTRGDGTMAGELVRHANPPRLQKLDLSGNRLAPELLGQLVASEAVVTVEDLDLSDNTLRTTGATALAGGRLPELRSLRLLRTQPQEAGVAALVAAAFFHELRNLSLGGNVLGPTSAIALARGATNSLRVLDLSDNRIGDRGAVALAESPRLANLIELDLAEAQIGDAGADALTESSHLGGLIYLNLFRNNISDGAADRLRARFGARVYL